MQRRSADVTGLVVEVVGSRGNAGIVRCVVPAQKGAIAEELIRIVLKGRFVVQPDLQLIATQQPTTGFQFYLAGWRFVIVNHAQRSDQGVSA